MMFIVKNPVQFTDFFNYVNPSRHPFQGNGIVTFLLNYRGFLGSCMLFKFT